MNSRPRFLQHDLNEVLWIAKIGNHLINAGRKQLFVSPESFNFLESVMILCMVVLGGMGSVPGVILGAVLLAFLPEVLRGVAEYRLIVFGAAMVALMQYRPQGLWPSARHLMEFGEEKGQNPARMTDTDARIGGAH